ncbi:MAG TPA: HisA/HisF-related TIM barrel protein [Vicinamibacterales bacterium]|nr:HisA/HisF-related TIM barrel protein [Vicinamibacterales bacterium]
MTSNPTREPPLPFALLGVIDLLRGHAVHAIAGVRERYAPVQRAAGCEIPSGDACALARAYIDHLGITEIYVADLDAILNRTPQDAMIPDLAALGASLWLDAAIRSVEDARRAIERGAARVVVGLETLPSFAALSAICDAVGGHRVVFSLDLRAGEPLVAGGVAMEPAYLLAARAGDAGARAVIVLDLARVGTGTGLDLALIARVRDAAPGVTLFAGGGVSGWEDLVRLHDAGCDGALVATALHDGRIGVREIRAMRVRVRNSQLPT